LIIAYHFKGTHTMFSFFVSHVARIAKDKSKISMISRNDNIGHEGRYE